MPYLEILATVAFAGSLFFGVFMVATMREMLSHVRQTAYVLTWPNDMQNSDVDLELQDSHICSECVEDNLN